jgi:6-phosphogluconolactonase
MSADGRYLYASNCGHDSLIAFAVGPDGLVMPCQLTPSGERWPWFFAVTDDGRMIVANNLSDNITVFDIDSRDKLQESGQVAVRRPVFIAPARLTSPGYH